MPVAHADVDGERRAGRGERGFERASLGERPAGERRRLLAGGFAEANLGVAVLQLLDHFVRQGAAASDLGEVFGHLAEDVGGSVSEQEDGGLVGLGHASIILHGAPPPPGVYHVAS